jgi:DNA-binding LacI/PurR family transcriptional regulator/signal transduction histidine kinase
MNTRASRRPVIGVLLNSLFDGYEMTVWKGLVRAAEEQDVDLVCFLGGSLGDGSRRSSLFDLVGPECVDALVVITAAVGVQVGPAPVAALVARMAPLPAVSLSEPLPGIASVLADNAAGMSALVEHLVVQHGHRRIAYVGGPAGSTEAPVRHQAYLRALERLGIPLDPALVVDGDWGSASGLRGVRTLLDRGPLDAIIASNDLMALAGLEELARRGVQVPERLALCGFDDIGDAAASLPALTTVRQPLVEMAREALRRALALSRGERVEPQVLFPAELVVRRSCGCGGQERAPPGTPAHGLAPSGRADPDAAARRRHLVRADEETRVLHRSFQPFPLPAGALERNLPAALDLLGIRSFFLCRYASADLLEAELLMRHDPDGVAGPDGSASPFPARRLVPGGFSGARRRSHAILPIQSPDGPIGFAVCEIGPMVAFGYEVLMYQISTAMSMNALLARLKDQQQRLLEAARQAGMAEVAVGTLHNVGNLLNSVGVSAEQIADTAAASTAGGVRRVAQLMTTHRDDLPAFFARDARAPHLVEYLERTSAQLVEEQGRMGGEAQALLERVKVIRDTIRGLHDMAREGYGEVLREPIELRVLVAAALESQAGFLSGHGVVVRLRDAMDSPRVVADRAKLLHVLINLIKNAAEAMRSRDEGERLLSLVTAPVDGGRVRITISDTGDGIPPESLDKVFSFGFTTKHDGHGFGLHTCALYVHQLGGSLVASSPGRGRGATFTIELPVEPAPPPVTRGGE